MEFKYSYFVVKGTENLRINRIIMEFKYDKSYGSAYDRGTN